MRFVRWRVKLSREYDKPLPGRQNDEELLPASNIVSFIFAIDCGKQKVSWRPCYMTSYEQEIES